MVTWHHFEIELIVFRLLYEEKNDFGVLSEKHIFANGSFRLAKNVFLREVFRIGHISLFLSIEYKQFAFIVLYVYLTVFHVHNE